MSKDQNQIQLKYSGTRLPSFDEFAKSFGISNDNLPSYEQIYAHISQTRDKHTEYRLKCSHAAREALLSLAQIREIISWLESPGKTRLQVQILLFAGFGAFYAFWNLCGNLLNVVHTLGIDYAQNAPNCAALLKKHKDQLASDSLFQLTSSAFNGRMQREIARQRELYVHKAPLEFGELRKVKDVQVADNQIQLKELVTERLSEDDAYNMIREGFFEIWEFMREAQTQVFSRMDHLVEDV